MLFSEARKASVGRLTYGSEHKCEYCEGLIAWVRVKPIYTLGIC